MPKSKKAKAKYKDFQKVKLKVGKTLQKSNNETNTSFKSRQIQLKKQLTSQGNEPVTRRKLNFNDLLSQCRHYSASIRQDAITGIRELAGNNSELLFSKLGTILELAAELCLDKEPAVRQAVVKLLKAILPKITLLQIMPFFPILSAHLCCAMTHIYDDIQMDSLTILDLLLDHYPSLVTGGQSNLLPNFIEQISRQSQTSSKKSTATGNLSRSLLINPNSKLSSQKWRVKVLQRLQKFLQAVLKLQLSDSSINNRNTCEDVYWSKNLATTVHPLGSSANSVSMGCGFQLSMKQHGSDTAGDSLFVNASQLKSFIHIIFPLLIQCWLEAGPSQLLTNLPGNTLGLEAVTMLAGVLGVLQLLLQYVIFYDKSSDNDVLKEIKVNYEKSIIQHILVHFPYAVHEKMHPKERKKLDTPLISTEAMNIQLCEIMAYLQAHNTTENLAHSSWMDRLISYACQTLHAGKVGGSHLKSLLVFVDISLNMESTKERCEQLLNAMFACYTAKRANSADKGLLVKFFAGLVTKTKLNIYGLKPLDKFLQTLPKLITQMNGNEGAERESSSVHVIFEVIRTIAAQQHQTFLQSLQENIANIFEKMLVNKCSQRNCCAVLDMVYYLPRIDRSHLQILSDIIMNERLDESSVQYLLNILLQRYITSTNKNMNCINIEDLLSFLFTLILGVRGDHLKKKDGQKKSALSVFRCTSLLSISEMASNIIDQFPESGQVWLVYIQHIHKLLAEQTLSSHECLASVRALTVSSKHREVELDEDFSALMAGVLIDIMIDSVAASADMEQEDMCKFHTEVLEACRRLLLNQLQIIPHYLKQLLIKVRESDLPCTTSVCQCLIYLLDNEHVVCAIKSSLPILHMIINATQERFKDQMSKNKSWNSLKYSVSLIK